MPPAHFATIATVQAAVLDLMSGPEPQFWAIGIRLFQSFAVIRIVWLGASMMLSQRHDLVDFIELFLLLSFGYAMVTFYGSPIPGIGIAFSDLIPSMAQYCANILDARALEQTFYHIDVMAAKFVAPDAWNVFQNLMYWILLIILAFTKAMAMLIIMGSLIAQSLFVLLGGLFVPFFIVPRLDFLFWGWIRALMTASFTQVVAMAYLMIYSRFLDRLVATMPPTIAAEQFPLYVVEVIVFVVVFTVGAMAIPIITGMLFSGGGPPSISLAGLR